MIAVTNLIAFRSVDTVAVGVDCTCGYKPGIIE
jgi:hypothetical protein